LQALGYLGEFITAGFWNPWGVLSTFRKVLSAFERDYARMVDAVLERIGDGDEKEVGAMCGKSSQQLFPSCGSVGNISWLCVCVCVCVCACVVSLYVKD